MEIRPTPRAIVWSDVDDSLVGTNADALAQSRDVLDRYSPDIFVGYCTGRGESGAAHQAPHLAGFPLQSFGINNGQKLYWNTRSEEAGHFIRTLAQRQEDPEWAAHVRSQAGRWDSATLRNSMLDTLHDAGFTAVPNPQLPAPYDTQIVLRSHLPRWAGVHFWVSQDQSQYYVYTPGQKAGPEQSAIARSVGALMQDRLDSAGVRALYRCTAPKGERVMSTFEPPNIHKLAQLRFVMARFPGLKAVVSVGDHDNDTHLPPEEIDGVPNLPILAGTRHPQLAQLRSHPRILLTAGGEVASALDQHLGTVLPSASSLAG